MTYIHDIFINLNYEFFEFYEWNKKDNIEHLKRIPIIRTNNKTLFNIINNQLIINPLFLKNYYQKSEKYHNNHHYNYIIITNCICAIAISFNEKGNILKKSSLIFEDEENVCLLARNIKANKIPYTIIKKEKASNLTRFQKECKKSMLNNIQKMDNNCLKYLYYDCFNQKEENISVITNSLVRELKDNNIDIINKCHNLINIIYQQNK